MSNGRRWRPARRDMARVERVRAREQRRRAVAAAALRLGVAPGVFAEVLGDRPLEALPLVEQQMRVRLEDEPAYAALVRKMTPTLRSSWEPPSRGRQRPPARQRARTAGRRRDGRLR